MGFKRAAKPEGTSRPAGFILTSFAVAPSVYLWATRWFASRQRSSPTLTVDDRRLFLHVLVCGARSRHDDGWVPVGSRLRAAELPEADHDRVVAAGLLEFRPHDKANGKSREYRVPPSARAAYADALVAVPSPGAEPGPAVDLFTGRQTARKARTLSRTPDGKRNVEPRALGAMRGVRYGLFDGPTVDRHLARSREAAGAARDRAEALAGMTLDRASAELGAEDGRLPAAAVGAVREALRLLGRYAVDAAVRGRLHRQVTGHRGDGVYVYQPAYRPQSTGRMTDVGGGLQNATREMKHAAWAGVPGVVNYDIPSSQPRQLRHEFVRARVPTGNLNAVLLTGKADHAAACGVEVDAWKGALMAIVTGAVLFRDFGAAHTRRGAPRGDVVRIVSAGVLPGVDPSEAYGLFVDRVQPLYKDLRAWRKWLVKVWLPAHRTQAAGRHYVRNEAGAVLCVSDVKPNDLPRKLAAHVLQGREARFIYEVTGLQDEHGYAVIANEHDGVVVEGEVPAAAIAKAKALANMPYVDLVEKSIL